MLKKANKTCRNKIKVVSLQCDLKIKKISQKIRTFAKFEIFINKGINNKKIKYIQT